MTFKKAYLHIGFPKTGTTTLQSFLHNNSNDLLKHGVLYPETGKLWHAQHDLAGLFQSDDKRLYWVKTDLGKPYFDLLKEEIKAGKASTLLLSSEAFTFTDKHSDLKDFINKCGFQDIKIICFLRRQDLWVESAFTQLYKTGLIAFDFNIYANNNKRLDYIAYLDIWKRVFGEENICVEIIDHELGHNDIVPAIIDMLGIDELAYKYSPERHNTTLSPDALHYSHLIHKENNNELLGWLLECLEKYSSCQNNNKFIFMLDAERKYFLEKFESINRNLAIKYLGRDKAFSEFNEFTKPIALYPKLNEVELGSVSNYTLSEIQKKNNYGQKHEWIEREQYIINQNSRIEEIKESMKTNKKIITNMDESDIQLMNSTRSNNTSLPKVAIITRTKNRPIMLPRLLISIGRQTFKNFVWVLVNDNGDRIPIDEVATKALKEDIDVIVIHREKSIGMEAASNDGIRQSHSKYIVIHDDDDTWKTEFLEKTVEYLEKNPNVPGVITGTNRIDESIERNSIRFQSITPYNHWLKSVYLFDIAIENRFAPISFLFRRSVYDTVGGFDEELPVLGDWDFNLKVLMEGDIHVVPYVLANYHFRINLEKDNIYGNTVTSGIDKHIFYDAIYRNKKLREDIKNGVSGIGTLLALGRNFNKIDYSSEIITSFWRATRNSRFISIIQKLLRFF